MQTCLGSSAAQKKGAAKHMVKLPNVVCGLLGIGAYAGMVSKGGTYHPVCIHLACRMWISWMLKVDKVAVKVGLKQPFSAGFMLQDLVCLALWVWVQDKSGTRHRQSQSGCFVLQCKVHPFYHMPTKQDTKHYSNNGQGHSWACQDSEKSAFFTVASFSAMAPSSCTYTAPSSTSIGSAPRGNKGRPSSTGSGAGPHCTHQPTSSSRMFGDGTPSSSSSPICRSSPCQNATSSSIIIFYSIGISCSRGSPKTL